MKSEKNNTIYTKKINKEKGTTLIALVITIIVLLILATVSIAMLTGKNGILGKAEKATEEHTEKSALEKLKLKLTEYIIDQNDNISKNLKEYLEVIDGCTEVREDDTADNAGGYITVIDDYEFRVTAKGEFLESLGKATSPMILVKQNGKNIEISITERGETITKIEVLNSENTVIKSVLKEEMTKEEQNYIVNHSFEENGTYFAKVTTQEGKDYTRKIVIDLTPPATPEISSNYGYPIITESGVKQDGTTKITYDTSENVENYYSLDGTNWQEYTGEFQYAQIGKIYAKSVKKSNGTEATASKEITIPNYALGASAYDKDDSTCEKMVYSKNSTSTSCGIVKISPEMIGKQVRVLVDSSSKEGGQVRIYNSSDTQLALYDKYRQKEYIITIPIGADYLGFYRNQNVYEVAPYNP